jgi:hypothetical protein
MQAWDTPTFVLPITIHETFLAAIEVCVLYRKKKCEKNRERKPQILGDDDKKERKQ